MNKEQKPVAYDTQGRPLYLHPANTPDTTPGVTAHDEIDVVQVTRSADPVAVTVSPEMLAKHEASKRKYPKLNLSVGEYVVLNVRRHPIGIVMIWLVTALLVLLAMFGWWYVLMHPGSRQPFIAPGSASFVSLFSGAAIALALVCGWVAVTVFKGNQFYLTNESVIQYIQYGLLAQKEQTINLENIKDASVDQIGFMPSIFGYGSLRLSTEGDEQEYHFTLIDNPKYQIDIINNVIEAVKYGRPIEDALSTITE